ncbi:DUF2442 domain-containing protein [filamentous cyanobacterium CCP5]|nr:DUF2442 domain-containing protein [filamentous cyanobacterium CCP5]
MTFLTIDSLNIPAVQAIERTNDTLSVDLSDGRTIAVPLPWYPRLLHGSSTERQDWRLIANAEGIHRNQLGEDISYFSR